MSLSATTQSALDAPLSVLQDSGSKVVISICVPGLKKRHSFLSAILSVFHKPKSPFRLASNAKFGTYSLTSHSLNFDVEVYDNKKSLKKNGTENKQRYQCNIANFPSKINPESAQFEVIFLNTFNPSPPAFIGHNAKIF